jgi:hypothetical protein
MWGVGVLSCVVDHILQESNTLFLTRFRTYKIATPTETKTPVKTTFKDWCLYCSFAHAVQYSIRLSKWAYCTVVCRENGGVSPARLSCVPYLWAPAIHLWPGG